MAAILFRPQSLKNSGRLQLASSTCLLAMIPAPMMDNIWYLSVYNQDNDNRHAIQTVSIYVQPHSYILSCFFILCDIKVIM